MHEKACSGRKPRAVQWRADVFGSAEQQNQTKGVFLLHSESDGANIAAAIGPRHLGQVASSSHRQTNKETLAVVLELKCPDRTRTIFPAV